MSKKLGARSEPFDTRAWAEETLRDAAVVRAEAKIQREKWMARGRCGAMVDLLKQLDKERAQ